MKKRQRRSRSLVTLHDVAKLVGVSPMTVSRFIGGSPNIRDSVRVRAAIEELRYSPNAAARSLASAGAIHIGLSYGNPSATFSSEFLVDLLENSGRAGCQLAIEKCRSPRSERVTADRLIKGRVAGVILPTPLCASQALLSQFEQASMRQAYGGRSL